MVVSAGVVLLALAAAGLAEQAAGRGVPHERSDRNPVAGLPASQSHSGADAAVAWYATSPTGPDETVLVQGHGLDTVASIALTALGTKQTATVTPLYTNTTSLAFLVPATWAWDVYEARIGSSTLTINQPDLWWAHGDAGETATPGGWIRVFGRALSLNSMREKQWRREQGGAPSRRALTERAVAAMRRGDVPAARQVLNQLDGMAAAVAPTLDSLPVLVLNGNTKITATNCSTWSAFFAVPTTVAAGSYRVQLQSGAAPLADLAVFISPDKPSVSTIEIRAPNPFPTRVFDVTTFNHSLADTLHSYKPGSCDAFSRSGHPVRAAVWYNSSTTAYVNATGRCQYGWLWDIPLARALAAARAAGGGAIHFPRGQYYLSTALEVPDNVVVTGAGMELTALYFHMEPNVSSLPLCHGAVGYFCGDNVTDDAHMVRWGLRDFAFYISSFHERVIEVHNRTDGFVMERVRARVNAFDFLDSGMLKGVGHKNNVVNGSKTPHPTPFTNISNPDAQLMFGLGELILMHGRNWEIVGCDLMTDASLLISFDWDINKQRHSAQFGRVAYNSMVQGAGGCHPEDAWQQVIFEHNECRGGSLLSGGWAVGSSMGGFSQNLYHASGVEADVWAADRETPTFDDAGGAYFGQLASIDGTRLTTLHDTRAAGGDRAPYGWEGGTLLICNGTGAGQFRRIVHAGIFFGPTPTNRSWTVDRPFLVQPDATSWIQIYTFRGRVLFTDTDFVDVGPFQTYGTSTEVILDGNRWTRAQMVNMEGQWRGWLPPGEVGGPQGVGLNPTMRNLVLDNEILEANGLAMYFDGLWRTGFFHLTGLGESGGKYDLDVSPPVSWHNVFRGNTVHNNAGIEIGEDTAGCVVEFNTVLKSDFGITVQLPQTVSPVVVRRNNATTEWHCCHGGLPIGP